MAVTYTNIAVGEGTLYVGPSTGTGVSVISGTSLGDDLTAVDVGATQDGISLSWEPTMVDIEIDQFGDAARVVQSRVKVMVNTKLAEATLTNLATAWGYPTGASGTTPGLQSGGAIFNFGTHGVYPEEHYIKITASAPGSTATVTKVRTYKCDRAIQYVASPADHKRDANTQLVVNFRILPLVNATGSEYGSITDA